MLDSSISNCCSAGIYEETDICMECKEHCSPIELCKYCEREYLEEEDMVMCDECITEHHSKYKQDGSIYVFVYGTLKKGFGNHHLLNKAECLDDRARTQEYYSMTGSGVPFVHHSPKKTMIKGELYKVNKNTLHMLDGLEGHPTWYKRQKVWVVDGYGGPLAKAWLYFNDNDRGYQDFPTGEFSRLTNFHLKPWKY
ncbi:MAG: putative gamma-glutamylcyclotransferase [Prokaryotic dsDNA virus sp.]|nr:MAG: putative gamma-glutamylcyclotransferase [Prokaryotic dsDNA virus sp.]|tara:strand:+ start:1928 stop:2515 length:588 start_codon:yes stop_codon:yes gene_type:complete